MGRSGRSARGRKDAAAAPAAESAAEPVADEDATPGDAPIAFERALERLEQTVARLEEGDMPLEEALDLFESGVRLSRQCSQQLDRAERRVEILVADREDGAAVEFEAGDDGGEDLAGEAPEDEALED